MDAEPGFIGKPIFMAAIPGVMIHGAYETDTSKRIALE